MNAGWVEPNFVTYWAPKQSNGNGELFSDRFQPPQRIDIVGFEGSGGITFEAPCQIEEGGYLLIGSSNVLDPRGVSGVMEVVELATKPDLRKLRQLKVVYVSIP